MDVSNAVTANQTLFLAAFRSNQRQQQAILQVVADAAQQAVEIARSKPGSGVGEVVDVSA